jgi:hypothetical protein
MMACVLDQLAACDGGDVDDWLEAEAANIDYNCPTNSYISAAHWPIVSFEDCTCYWGHTRSDTDETCSPIAATTLVTPIQTALYGGCFCDGTAPRHCMHQADKSCGTPVLVADQSKRCDDPSKALSPDCVCAAGTVDCRGTAYSLQVTTAPSLGAVGEAFGVQPVVRLLDHTGTVVKDSTTRVRVSIANAQDESCKCADATPCRHSAFGDNSCFAKQKLFGNFVCPAGTVECLPSQTATMLYQKHPGEDSIDATSLERRTKECRTTLGMQTQAGNGFCTGQLPCKHQNDGALCVFASTFQLISIALDCYLRFACYKTLG